MPIVKIPTLVVDFKDLKNGQLFILAYDMKGDQPSILYRKIIPFKGHNAIPENKSGEGESGGLIAISPSARVVPFA